jgi:hypothetical protein
MAQDLGPWSPLALDEAARLMDGLGAPWWVAGGWAIDLFLGRTTRPHADLDLAMLRREQGALLALERDGWELHVAADGMLTRWQVGDFLEGGARHQLWARPAPGAPWALEILFEEALGDDWLFRRDARIRLPLARFGRRPAEGPPFVAPEVALLYKAKEPELARNAADFDAAQRPLGAFARAWLREAIETTHPGHPWSRRLCGKESPAD